MRREHARLLKKKVEEDLVERYLGETNGYFSQVKPSEAKEALQQTAENLRLANRRVAEESDEFRAAKARSRGFRDVKNFITMIYLIGAKLEFQLPEVLLPTHTK